MFLTLVEAWKNTSSQLLINKIGECLDNLSDNEGLVIEKCLFNGDWNTIDDNYDEHKESMKKFISWMNPTESSEMTDVSIIEAMHDIQKQINEILD